jgi:hypothetical protein
VSLWTYVAVLLIAAGIILLWIYFRLLGQQYLREMAEQARRSTFIAEEWEHPRIVATYGGIHDVEEDGW